MSKRRNRRKSKKHANAGENNPTVPNVSGPVASAKKPNRPAKPHKRPPAPSHAEIVFSWASNEASKGLLLFGFKSGSQRHWRRRPLRDALAAHNDSNEDKLLLYSTDVVLRREGELVVSRGLPFTLDGQDVVGFKAEHSLMSDTEHPISHTTDLENVNVHPQDWFKDGIDIWRPKLVGIKFDRDGEEAEYYEFKKHGEWLRRIGEQAAIVWERIPVLLVCHKRDVASYQTSFATTDRKDGTARPPAQRPKRQRRQEREEKEARKRQKIHKA